MQATFDPSPAHGCISPPTTVSRKDRKKHPEAPFLAPLNMLHAIFGIPMFFFSLRGARPRTGKSMPVPQFVCFQSERLRSVEIIEPSPLAASPSALGNIPPLTALSGKLNIVGEQEVANAADLMGLFNAGNNQRKVGGTKMNAESSRSHSVFSILLEVTVCATSKRSDTYTQRTAHP